MAHPISPLSNKILPLIISICYLKIAVSSGRFFGVNPGADPMRLNQYRPNFKNLNGAMNIYFSTPMMFIYQAYHLGKYFDIKRKCCISPI